MNKKMVLGYEFVKTIPEKLAERTIYVSLEYATVAHKCCCGCGREVVTPLSPTDWNINYDGVSISLSPSIGNWSFDCGSHYWIVKNTVRWADRWSKERIGVGRAHDRRAKQEHYTTHEKIDVEKVARGKSHPGFWSKIWKRLSR